VWRPDGKGRRGLEEDYDYVMYGKVGLILFHFKPLECLTSIVHETYCRCINSMEARPKLCKDQCMTSAHCSLCADVYDLCRTAYASFGGLLMSLTGSFRHMTNVVLGDPVYLLMRK
jgi:DNA-directed RNA polymerase I, II, and III subunit RPABC3